jgi:hypothetical protein
MLPFRFQQTRLQHVIKKYCFHVAEKPSCSEILRYVAECKIESARKYESIPSCSLLKHVRRTELDICCSGKYFDTTSGISRTETWEGKEEGMINCMHTFIQNYNAGT